MLGRFSCLWKYFGSCLRRGCIILEEISLTKQVLLYIHFTLSCFKYCLFYWRKKVRKKCKISFIFHLCPETLWQILQPYPLFCVLYFQLPTLIVYGSRDERLGFASRDSLKVLPASQIAEIPDAGHACYMNQPALFHNLLYWFLNKLSA